MDGIGAYSGLGGTGSAALNILVKRYMWVVGNGIGLPRRKF
jgi:hypothetical protein